MIVPVAESVSVPPKVAEARPRGPVTFVRAALPVPAAASETKPVAVAFVTQDVDAWYAWLTSRGVRMRSLLADSKSLPIRGFTAYDPEGYTLEFETFRDDPQNSRIKALLKAPR